MRLIFKESVYAELVRRLRENPEAEGVCLTGSELIAVYEEVLNSEEPTNAIFLSCRAGRHLIVDGRSYAVTVGPPCKP